jgi:uncharacterized membrane protein
MATSTKLNKTQKIIKWATQDKNRNMADLKRELDMSEAQVMRHIRRIKRSGLIAFIKVGKKVSLHSMEAVKSL